LAFKLLLPLRRWTFAGTTALYLLRRQNAISAYSLWIDFTNIPGLFGGLCVPAGNSPFGSARLAHERSALDYRAQ
jgi:hypothetical protein